MAQHTIPGNEKLAQMIRKRRIELQLTIEEAASRAGVGTKTWSRYEAGESIRVDKSKGICRALNWRAFPDEEREDDNPLSVEKYRNHEAWSKYLEDNHGQRAAISFAIGSDILLDNIKQDLEGLESLPAGSHVGQLDFSLLKDELPPQFLMRYDYDFLYHMKCELLNMRRRAGHGMSMMAHSVLDELLIYLCNEEALGYIEIIEADDRFEGEEEYKNRDWEFDLFDDMDIVTCLYSEMYIDEENIYHYVHWNEQQFYMDNAE